MKTPSFWYATTPATYTYVLKPLSFLYASLAHLHKSWQTARPINAPVICLGNLVAGGSGKTPTAIALLKLLRDRNIFLSPAFVTRGYKGKIEGPERVDDTNNPVFWGDEALLLARTAPTYVAHNRYEGAKLAAFNGADAIILDDGLQNYSLTKDISFCVIDGLMGFGNKSVIPLGPLRQPLNEGMAATNAFILIGDDQRGIRHLLPADKPVCTARLDVREPVTLAATPYIAFCGIGFPDKFKNTLLEKGVKLAGWHPFPDHHSYTMADITRLVDEAIRAKARLITTEKDFVRMPDFHQKSMIDVLPVEIVFDSPDAVVAFILSKTRPSL